jgi:hypothetical protein
VRHLSELTGVSAQQASVLSATMRYLGVNVDDANIAFGRLSVNIEKGVLDKYGIEVKRAADGSINFNNILKEVARQFEENRDVTSRNAEMTALFGRGWQALIPILSQGADGLQKLEEQAAQHTYIFDEQDINNAKDLRDCTAATVGCDHEHVDTHRCCPGPRAARRG